MNRLFLFINGKSLETTSTVHLNGKYLLYVLYCREKLECTTEYETKCKTVQENYSLKQKFFQKIQTNFISFFSRTMSKSLIIGNKKNLESFSAEQFCNILLLNNLHLKLSKGETL